MGEKKGQGSQDPDQRPKSLETISFVAWFTNEYPKSQDLSDSKFENAIVAEKKKISENFFQEQINRFEHSQKKKGGSDEAWIATLLKKGTLSDRMAAVTVKVQEEPLFRFNLVEQLMGMAKKNNRRESQMAIGTLKDLFLLTLLPFRNLHYFIDRPLTSTSDRKILFYWFFEDKVKRTYTEFLEILEKASCDSILTYKEAMVKYIYELLCEKPEQERKVLRILVNKLGDPVKALCSKVSWYLTSLLEKFPDMKVHVTGEVENCLLRLKENLHAQHYGVMFLNQMVFSRKDTQLPQKLIKTYLALLKKQLVEGEIEQKVLDGILTGIARAFPFAKPDPEMIEEFINPLFKFAYIAGINKSIRTLQVLFLINSSIPEGDIADRFYRLLYSILLREELKHSSMHKILLNLLFKALNRDASTNRIKAFIKRLIQVSMNFEPNFICASLYLIYKVFAKNNAVATLVKELEESDEEEQFVDADKEEKPNVKNSKKFSYDPSKADPKLANAQSSCLWELLELKQHYHPSVQKFATQLLEGTSISYDGDLLDDLSSMAFLERFVYKNPKLKDTKPDSIFKPAQEGPSSQKDQPVNSESFLSRTEAEIPENELFFYNYFKKMKEINPQKKKKKVDLELVDEESLKEGEYDYDDLGNEDFSDDLEEEGEDFNINEFVNEEDSDINEEDGESEAFGSSFAPAEEFAHLLEQSGDPNSGENVHQTRWEERSTKSNYSDKKGKRKRIHSKKTSQRGKKFREK